MIAIYIINLLIQAIILGALVYGFLYFRRFFPIKEIRIHEEPHEQRKSRVIVRGDDGKIIKNI